ncbi:MAG: hypothetical protein ACRC3H_07400 [Lachnospiraceae bacterium]
MKVLISPMSAMAETSGSFSRIKILADALLTSGHEVAVCAAEDINYKPIQGAVKYELSTPMPLGLPKTISSHMFPLAQKLGINKRKTVNSFEEVLFLAGNINYKYLRKSTAEIQKAIQDYKPEVVYSEFNIAAVIAAVLEQKRLFTTASLPTQSIYARTPKYAKGINA